MWTHKNENRIVLEAYDTFADRLYRYAFLRTSSKEVAEDIVQEVFLKLCDYIGSGNMISEMERFLMRSIRNAVIDFYRKKKSLSLEMIEEGGFVISDDPDLSFYDDIDVKRAMRALHELPDKYKDILIMRFVDGLTPQDIAEELNESANVISVRIHRAIGELKKQMHI